MQASNRHATMAASDTLVPSAAPCLPALPSLPLVKAQRLLAALHASGCTAGVPAMRSSDTAVSIGATVTAWQVRGCMHSQKGPSPLQPPTAAICASSVAAWHACSFMHSRPTMHCLATR
eukprot:274357-Chlamydomonas_euryale.AAC.3